jgi:hypothetical protein
MKVVLKLNNKLSTGINPGATSKGLWGAIQGEIENQKDLVEYIDEKILSVGYITEEELEGKGYITSIPEEYITESELDAKEYLTEHQDLTHLATKEELSGYQVKGDYLTSIPSEYAKKSDIPDTSKFITEIPEDYAKKSDIPTDYLTSIPSEYITETELNAKGYITSIPSEYAKKSDIPDVSSFVTEDQLNTTLGDIEQILDNIIG